MLYSITSTDMSMSHECGACTNLDEPPKSHHHVKHIVEIAPLFRHVLSTDHQQIRCVTGRLSHGLLFRDQNSSLS